MSIYIEIKEWLGMKFAKTINAQEAHQMAVSDASWKRLMYHIKQCVEYGHTTIHRDIPDEFRDRLLSLNYAIINNGSVDVLRYDVEPSVEELDKRIQELVKKRDEIKKREMIEQLSGISNDSTDQE